ncbi:MAG: energy transducer TonB [Polyangiaceae bacterium]|nr:energy transducer TonB [Polyangiaceae bacterium]
MDSRYLGAPKLATTPAEVEACAAKSAVVKRKGYGGGIGVGGLGTLGHAAGDGSVRGGVPQMPQGGLGADQVRRVVSAHVGALRACYEKELQRNPKLIGRVTLKWGVEPDGTVSAASIASSTLANPAVESCLVRQVRSWHFPAAQSPTVVNAYPFLFNAGP